MLMIGGNSMLIVEKRIRIMLQLNAFCPGAKLPYIANAVF